MSDFFGQGGYAGYVLPAYAISVFALALLVVWTLEGYRKAKARLKNIGAP